MAIWEPVHEINSYHASFCSLASLDLDALISIRLHIFTPFFLSCCFSRCLHIFHAALLLLKVHTLDMELLGNTLLPWF